MVQRKRDVPEGDKRAWEHAVRTQFQMLEDEEVRTLVELALYTRAVVEKKLGGMTEAELEQLLRWADFARINNALLENALSGAVFVHVELGKQEPTFRLTPKGEDSAVAIGEKLGLPPLHEEGGT